MATQVQLLNNASATGAAAIWPGGRGLLMCEGTFAGATVQLQSISPNGIWLNAPAAGVTAAGTLAFELPPGQIRAAISGGPPSAMFAYATGMGFACLRTTR